MFYISKYAYKLPTLFLQVITAPYPTGFNHLKIADEVHFKLQRATQKLAVSDLPTYGLGHSLGSLIQMLIGATYPAPRNGNILMSFNNKNVLDSVPFFAPFIAPGARVLAPILSQVRSHGPKLCVQPQLQPVFAKCPRAMQQKPSSTSQVHISNL